MIEIPLLDSWLMAGGLQISVAALGGLLLGQLVVELLVIRSIAYYPRLAKEGGRFRPGGGWRQREFALLALLVVVAPLLGMPATWEAFPAARSYMAAIAAMMVLMTSFSGYHFIQKRSYHLERVFIIVLAVGQFFSPWGCLPFLLFSSHFYGRISFPIYVSKTDSILLLSTYVGGITVLAVYSMNAAFNQATFFFVQFATVAAFYIKPVIGKLKIGWPWRNRLVDMNIAAERQNQWTCGLKPENLAKLRDLLRRTNRFALVMTLLLQSTVVVGFLHQGAFAVYLCALIAFHLLVFALSGIFFWKWIVAETALLLFGFDALPFGVPLFLAGAGYTLVYGLLSAGPYQLGWFDSPVSHRFRFVAVGKDEQRVTIAPEDFEPLSFTFAQARFFPLVDRVTLGGCFGALFDQRALEALRACKDFSDFQKTRNLHGSNQWSAATTNELSACLLDWALSRNDTGGRFVWTRMLRCAHHIYSGVPTMDSGFVVRRVEVLFQEFLQVGDRQCPGAEELVLEVEVVSRDRDEEGMPVDAMGCPAE